MSEPDLSQAKTEMGNRTRRVSERIENRRFNDAELQARARPKRHSESTLTLWDLSLVPAPLLIRKASCPQPARNIPSSRNASVTDTKRTIDDRCPRRAAKSPPQSKILNREGNATRSASDLAAEYISTCVQQPDEWRTPEPRHEPAEWLIHNKIHKTPSVNSSEYSTDIDNNMKKDEPSVHDRLQWYKDFFQAKPFVTLSDDDTTDRLFDRLLEDIKFGPSIRGDLKVCAFWNNVRSQLREVQADEDEYGVSNEGNRERSQRQAYGLRSIAERRPGQRLWAMMDR